MPSPRERSPKEREKLIFSAPEQAREFSERVAERSQQESRPGVTRRREALALELAQEFAKHGEEVNLVKKPWEHTQHEHKEAQQLVDLAFAKDLSIALNEAQNSNSYPRNLDLFHDVLTGDLYELLREHGLNKQRLMVKPIITGVIVVIVVLLAVLLLFIVG